MSIGVTSLSLLSPFVAVVVVVVGAVDAGVPVPIVMLSLSTLFSVFVMVFGATSLVLSLFGCTRLGVTVIELLTYGPAERVDIATSGFGGGISGTCGGDVSGVVRWHIELIGCVCAINVGPLDMVVLPDMDTIDMIGRWLSMDWA